MEEFEKNLNENEISAEEETVGINGGEAPASDTAENISETNIQTEAELVVSPEQTELVSAEEPTAPVYRWNYEEQKDYLNGKEKKKHKNGAVIYAVVMTCAFAVAFILLAVLLILNGLGIGNGNGGSGDQSGVGASAERVVYVREYDPESGVLTTQEIYNKCLPAIVTVSVTDGTSSGVGSGFIISEDGFIVTANHVIDGMTSITVIMSNGDRFPAKVIDGNAFTDLALIKVATNGLPTIAIGKSSDLLVGDRVVAIGTPAAIDFAGSLSEGNVSYNDRVFKIYNEDGSVEKKMILIQTSALVNPGNSGCPLINEYGEVVGIVTMKLNSSYYEGMCFAIPSDSAMPIITAMKNGENYNELLSAVSKYPAKMGITVENAVSSNNTPGVKITAFSSDIYDISQKMKVGDVIVSVDATTVTSITDLSYILDKYEPGDTIRVTFYRNSQKLTVDVILGQ